jgi:hypothetical protein
MAGVVGCSALENFARITKACNILLQQICKKSGPLQQDLPLSGMDIRPTTFATVCRKKFDCYPYLRKSPVSPQFAPPKPLHSPARIHRNERKPLSH